MKETTYLNDYESLKKKALEQFRSGKSLTGKRGAFAPLLKQFLEAALQSELEDHLQCDDNIEAGNRKNGKVSKTVKTNDGAIELVSNRDRNGSFEPSIVKKRNVLLFIFTFFKVNNSVYLENVLFLGELTHKNISKKWTQPLQNWSLTVSQLSIHFEGRLTLL